MRQGATRHILAITLMALCSAIGPAAGVALADEKLDRTVPPIPEPKRPNCTELDVRKVTPPPQSEVRPPEGAPNVLETTGRPEPTMVNGTPQPLMDGVSMAYSFDNGKAKEHHTTQQFEMFGNRQGPQGHD
jgi:hypothetical protein